MTSPLSVSVLIPSWRRPGALLNCLRAMAVQTLMPVEVLVIWQTDDEATREVAESCRALLGDRLRVIHSREAGVVPAENTGLAAATGDLIALTDDDAVPPPDWLAQLIKHFENPAVGMAGGPIDNFHPDGSRFSRSSKSPIARVTWYGKIYGNSYDLPVEWRSRPVEHVDHVAGGNMMFRRGLVMEFETGLRKYWQYFELEASFQVRSRGLKIAFDFGCVVEHHPTNVAFVGGRDGDLTMRVFNAAHNFAFVLAKHSPWYLRPIRLLFLLGVGNTQVPGLIGSLLAWRRYGHVKREWDVLRQTWRSTLVGWAAGRRATRKI